MLIDPKLNHPLGKRRSTKIEFRLHTSFSEEI